MSVSKAVFEKLTRAQALVASTSGRRAGFEDVLEAVLTEFIERRDPVKRAERSRVQSSTLRAQSSPPYTPDCGTEALSLCPRWRKMHACRRLGGTNAVENLATLCSFHHDLVHQLSLPIEGQVTWLRAGNVRYSA